MRNNFGLGTLIWTLVGISVVFSLLENLFYSPVFLLIIAGLVGWGAVSAIKKSQNNTNPYQKTYGSTTRRTTYSTNTSLNSTQLTRITNYLKEWYSENKSLPIGTNIDLRLHDTTFTSLSSLDVYRDNTYICTLEDFKNRYPDSYVEIMKEVDGLASRNSAKKAAAEQKAAEAARPKDAQYYIQEIDRLNNEIPDEEISNGLYETTSLLKQIDKLQTKFPSAKDKLKKLYEYYLPILVKILNQYESLQTATMDPSLEETSEKLKKTIKLINDAMKTIISSMTDEDFINLSADMQTLEAVLQKDGLTADSNMTMNGSSEKSTENVQ